jgi:hypothetical protein
LRGHESSCGSKTNAGAQSTGRAKASKLFLADLVATGAPAGAGRGPRCG